MTTGRGGSGPRPDLSGARLGHYELLSRIGAGGMGDVYRARDTRLLREVAVKVLPADVSSDPERLRRFEAEARAASALNHPNIVTVYDVGSSNGVSYIAMELVEGKTLRELLSTGPLPLKRTLEIAARVTDGLARAHEAGVVHRDIKPENVMVTKNGSVKILDFGLAKRARAALELGAGEAQTTMTVGTEPGVVLGTVRYMSPEQAAARAVDFRTDQFSFGSVLYEMATGKPAFSGDTSVDTLSAILHAEPEPVIRLNPQVPPPLGWIVERCLAKDAEGRYASTRDLARDVAGLRDHLSEISAAGVALAAWPRPPLRAGAVAIIATLLAALAGAYFVGEHIGRGHAPRPHFQQVTFRNAGISSARFAPDGQTIVFAAQSEGKPIGLFTTRVGSPETRSLGLPPAEILSIGATGEMAILLIPPFGLSLRPPHADLISRDWRLLFGTLAQVSLAGGTPREILDNVLEADWSPDSKTLAVVRFADGESRLEFPIGKKTVVETGGSPQHPRVSPDGSLVAFQDSNRLFVGDSRGVVPIIKNRCEEVAWSRSTGEVWCNMVSRGTTELHASTPAGRQRLVAVLPGDFVLHDIAADGQVLLGRAFESAQILGRFPGESRDRDLSWLDRGLLVDISGAGDAALFNAIGSSGEGWSPLGRKSEIYLRRTDGSPPKRLGEGYALALSADGRNVLCHRESNKENLVSLPTGAGEPNVLDHGKVLPHARGDFFADGKRIFFMGHEGGHRTRAYVQEIDGGQPRPVGPEGIHRGLLSGDGTTICARPADGDWILIPVDGGEVRKASGVLAGEEPIQWSGGGRLLYVRGVDLPPVGQAAYAARVYRVDPWTGRRELWKEIPPLDPISGGGIGTIRFSADGKTCVYSHHRYVSELYVAEGLR